MAQTDSKIKPTRAALLRRRADALEEQARIDRELAELEADAGTDVSTHYSTDPGNWPPRARSHRHARDLIRRVTGHEQIGTGRSTSWRILRATFDAATVRRRALHAVAVDDDEAIVEAALAGLRRTA